MKLKDKVCLITGSARGIGSEIARLFGKNGAAVVITYLNSKRDAESLISEIPNSSAYHLDVTQSSSVKRIIETVAKKYKKIDVLINNASYSGSGTWDLDIESIKDSVWDNVVKTDLYGMFYCCKYAVPLMKKKQSGNIINISSSSAINGDPTVLLYTAAKAGIDAFTKSLARKVAPDIRVNSIAPGSIATDWLSRWHVPKKEIDDIIKTTPLKKIGDPIDIANAALFLASDDSKFITGQTLIVDGGVTIK